MLQEAPLSVLILLRRPVVRAQSGLSSTQIAPLSLLEMEPLSKMMPLYMAPLSFLEMAPLAEVASLSVRPVHCTAGPFPRTCHSQNLHLHSTLGSAPTIARFSYEEASASGRQLLASCTRCTSSPAPASRNFFSSATGPHAHLRLSLVVEVVPSGE